VLEDPLRIGASTLEEAVELEHAARWMRSGTSFCDADEELRAMVRGDHATYAALPTETEANAAASSLAREVLDAEEMNAIQQLTEYADLVSSPVVPSDVVGATLRQLGGRERMKPLRCSER
jgi:hypothetical protein